MKTALVIAIAAIGLLLTARDLFIGFRSGKMKILATNAPTADRAATPRLFWFYAAFNLFIGTALLFVLMTVKWNSL